MSMMDDFDMRWNQQNEYDPYAVAAPAVNPWAQFSGGAATPVAAASTPAPASPLQNAWMGPAAASTPQAAAPIPSTPNVANEGTRYAVNTSEMNFGGGPGQNLSPELVSYLQNNYGTVSKDGWQIQHDAIDGPLQSSGEGENMMWNPGPAVDRLWAQRVGAQKGEQAYYYDPDGTFKEAGNVDKWNDGQTKWALYALAAMTGGIGLMGGFGAAAGAGLGAAEGLGAGAGITGFGDAGLMYGGLDAAAAGSLGMGGAAGATAAAGLGGITGFGDAGLMYGGADAGAASSLGMGEVGAATAAESGLSNTLSKAALDGTDAFGANSVANAYPLASAPGAASALSGLSNLLTPQNGLKAASLISQLTGGSPSSGSTGGSSSGGLSGGLGSLGDILGGLGLSDLGGLGTGLLDAYQQGKSSDKMLEWMNGQQGKIDNLYKPGSPEYNALWDEMSRKDAAAGRNSQYGPRSVDLAGRIAQIKADNTAKLTQGLAGNYSSALNQDASKYSGLESALGKLLGGQTGTTGATLGSATKNLSSILSGLSGVTNLGSGMSIGADGAINGIGDDGWTGGTMTNDEIDNIINGTGFGSAPSEASDYFDWF